MRKNIAPKVVAVLYALLVICCAYVPLSDPDHEHMMSTLMLTLVNLPWSLVVMVIPLFLPDQTTSYVAVFLLYLIFGSLWWYWITRLVIMGVTDVVRQLSRARKKR